LLLKGGSQIEIRSRNNKDLTHQYPAIAAAGGRLAADQVALDGEIVALGPDGRPSFQALQHRSHPGYPTVFYAFDVLHLDGRDLTREPFAMRRARLPTIVPPDSLVRLSRELPGTAADVVQAVRSAGLEGVIAKRKGSLYEPGARSHDWVKLKLERQQVRGTCDCRVRILAAALKSFCRVRGRLNFG
jgi:bifunctional non-homologous end joining protein LigD